MKKKEHYVLPDTRFFPIMATRAVKVAGCFFVEHEDSWCGEELQFYPLDGFEVPLLTQTGNPRDSIFLLFKSTRDGRQNEIREVPERYRKIFLKKRQHVKDGMYTYVYG